MKKGYILSVLILLSFVIGLVLFNSDASLYSQEEATAEDTEATDGNAEATSEENKEQLTEVIGLIIGKDKKKYAAPDWTLSVFARNGDKDIPVSKIEVKVDNSEFIEYSGPAQLLDYPKDNPTGKITAGGFTIEREGVHFIQARATDILGNVGPITKVELFIDGTAPSIDYELFNFVDGRKTSPYKNDTGTFVSAKHEIYFHAFDMRSGIDLEKFQYQLNAGGFKKYCEAKDEVECVDKFLTIPDAVNKDKSGWYIYTVKAADRVGNECPESAVTVYLDNKTPKPVVKPLFMEYSKSEKKYTSIDNQFSIVHEDLESGTKLIEIKIDNKDSKWDPYRKPIQFSTSGEHTIFMKATDNVGNVEENTYIVNIVIDPPNTQVVQREKPVKNEEETEKDNEEKKDDAEKEDKEKKDDAEKEDKEKKEDEGDGFEF